MPRLYCVGFAVVLLAGALIAAPREPLVAPSAKEAPRAKEAPSVERVEPLVRVWTAVEPKRLKDGYYAYHCCVDCPSFPLIAIDEEEGELVATGEYRLCKHCLKKLAKLTPKPADPPKPFSGKVTAVSDGDTLTVLDANKVERKIRLEGIDAPEIGQAFGTKAKQALSEKVFNKEVKIAWEKRDRYGRILGHVYDGERWINCELVADGFAWLFTRYSDDKRLGAAEQAARGAMTGLWSDKAPQAPWDNRAERREKTKAKSLAAKKAA
jgi:endonuclease YncB( thermonuclease family)